MEQYFIKIVRSSAIGLMKVYKIELDGFQVGKLAGHSELNIPTNPGNHILRFIWMGKTEKIVQINIPEGQNITFINSKLNIWTNKIELETQYYFQNTINSSEYLMSQNNNLYDINQNFKKRKKHFRLLTGLIVASVLLIFIFIAPDDSSKNADNTNLTNTNIVEMSEEEKAKVELDKATEQFSNGKYHEALEICNEISNTYPNTEISSNMKQYIKQQYAQFPQFTAKQLMSEYESNIVNADKEYTNRIMVVSGVISKIDKTNNDKNLCILLDSGTIFYSVQLNFNTSQTDSLSTLKENDTIKAIGKCTGKSGKYFLVFDGENVMINDCILAN